MAHLSKTCETEIKIYLKHKNVVMKVNDILDDLELGTCLLWEDIDYDICEEYISLEKHILTKSR